MEITGAVDGVMQFAEPEPKTVTFYCGYNPHRDPESIGFSEDEIVAVDYLTAQYLEENPEKIAFEVAMTASDDMELRVVADCNGVVLSKVVTLREGKREIVRMGEPLPPPKPWDMGELSLSCPFCNRPYDAPEPSDSEPKASSTGEDGRSQEESADGGKAVMEEAND
jgi:hypothetical protein